jgi:aldose 1-epimerase
MKKPPLSDLKQLSAHDFACQIDPAHGGLITDLVWSAPDGHQYPLLFGQNGVAASRDAPNRFGLWPLVPFANRAYGGVIDDGTDRFTVALNDPATSSAIHGFGLQSAWTVTAHDPHQLAMRHDRKTQPGGDPYAYEATMRITLAKGHVEIALEVINRAARSLPYGLGLHPWFPRREDTTITLQARGELGFHQGGYKASHLVPFEAGGPYATATPLGMAHETAHSLIDWAGKAVISSWQLGLSLEIEASDNARHPVLWAPPKSDFVCFEPQTHAIGSPSEAIAREIAPLTRVKPGEHLAMSMRIRPRLLP